MSRMRTLFLVLLLGSFSDSVRASKVDPCFSFEGEDCFCAALLNDHALIARFSRCLPEDDCVEVISAFARVGVTPFSPGDIVHLGGLRLGGFGGSYLVYRSFRPEYSSPLEFWRAVPITSSGQVEIPSSVERNAWCAENVQSLPVEVIAPLLVSVDLEGCHKALRSYQLPDADCPDRNEGCAATSAGSLANWGAVIASCLLLVARRARRGGRQ